MTTDVRKCTGGVLEPHVLGVQRAVDVPVDYPRVGAAGKAVSAAGGEIVHVVSVEMMELPAKLTTFVVLLLYGIETYREVLF